MSVLRVEEVPTLFLFVCLLFLFSFFESGFHCVVKSWLLWNSLDEAGLKLRDVCLCLSSAGIKGMCHHHPTGTYSLVWLLNFRELSSMWIISL